jgi:hypothetical protein
VRIFVFLAYLSLLALLDLTRTPFLFSLSDLGGFEIPSETAKTIKALLYDRTRARLKVLCPFKPFSLSLPLSFSLSLSLSLSLSFFLSLSLSLSLCQLFWFFLSLFFLMNLLCRTQKELSTNSVMAGDGIHVSSVYLCFSWHILYAVLTS